MGNRHGQIGRSENEGSDVSGIVSRSWIDLQWIDRGYESGSADLQAIWGFRRNQIQQVEGFRPGRLQRVGGAKNVGFRRRKLFAARREVGHVEAHVGRRFDGDVSTAADAWTIVGDRYAGNAGALGEAGNWRERNHKVHFVGKNRDGDWCRVIVGVHVFHVV